MILVLGIWALVLGYTLIFLGIDKIGGGKRTLGEVFLPGYLSRAQA